MTANFRVCCKFVMHAVTRHAVNYVTPTQERTGKVSKFPQIPGKKCKNT